MDFITASQLSTYLSKDYAEDFFRLLVNYQDISASEAASRLNLHIKTAQDFLEGLTGLDILTKKEVHEKKRPYYRYTLKDTMLKITVDLNQFALKNPAQGLTRVVREAPNAGANYNIARSGDAFSAVTIWEGIGREQKERRINLTTPQGKFLFHLPFPQSKPLTILQLMKTAGVDEEFSSEVQNLVDELVKLGVIEIVK